MISTYLQKLSLVSALIILPLSDSILRSYGDNSNNTSNTNSVSEIKSITLENTVMWLDVYDSINHNFITRKDGIADAFLNEVNNNRYSDADYLDYFRRVDSLENIGTWVPLKIAEAGLSHLATNFTAINNFEIIEGVDSIARQDLKDEYVPLKDVLLSLDSINIKNLKPREKLRQMYNYLTDHIQAGKTTINSVAIEKLASGQLGDCNDVSPAFYALLEYYGFDSGMCFGRSIDDNGKSVGYHVWIGVNLPEGYIELDPTWYNAFVPLEERCDSIEWTGLKKQFIRKKK
jgi:hypothetical protein